MKASRWTVGLGGVVSLLVLGVLAASADAPELGVGDRMPEIALEDQHGETRAIDASTRLVLFSRDMEGGKLLQEALAETEPGFLSSRGAAYLSDISGMPRLVARMFAIPSMRRRPYPMLLDRTGEATATLPDAPGRATILFLDGLRIERVEQRDSVDGVRTLLGLTGSSASE